ncbi:GerMN domain-containing protein [Leptolyngbya sp. AN02str]|uniref:GerMN domain-containing protein n=1 Tax=Leptolyngbya sp. AN02str TaxID=3423363 RepID=UPI003D31DBF3
MHNDHTHQQSVPTSHQAEPATPVESSHHNASRIPLSVATALTAVVLLAGSATAWFTWQTITARQTEESRSPIETVVPTQPSPTAPTAQVPQNTAHQPSENPAAQAETTVQIYWVKDTGTRLELAAAPITIQDQDQPQDVLTVAFEQLLQGPESTTVASTIPNNTQLRSLDVESDGIHVDLSKEFTTGGGSASMMGRLAQVIYTASTLDPNAEVWISVEGQPLEVLGGEGIMIDQPMTRGDFQDEFNL